MSNASGPGGSPPPIAPKGPVGWIGILIGPAFLLLGAWFHWGPDLADIPTFTAVEVDRSALSSKPRREPLDDPPTVTISGFEQTCMSCHRVFPAREVPPGKKLLQHTHVVLEHGINDRCRNCHDVENRDLLRLQSGETIPYSRVVELCSKCHGPTYRDWSRGMHGRTDGYWNETLGEMHRLGCTACHDPHTPQVPAMAPLRPLPAPHTLRAEATGEAAVHVENDPLRRALDRWQHDTGKGEPAHDTGAVEESE